MKKLWKSAAALLVALTLCLGLGAPALAYGATDAGNKADALNVLNLFKGTDQGYELDKPLTRMHALIMLIRLTGQENEALYGGEWSHPFTDAPTWDGADSYIGYAYEKGLTTGATATKFNPNEQANAQMFVTFALRALGYTDGSNGTVWDNWASLAKDAGILPTGVNTTSFLRGDAVLVSYAALDAKVQGGTGTLADKLMDAGVFNALSLATARVLTGKTVTADSALLDILGAVYAGTEDTLSTNRLATTAVSKDNLSFYFGVDTLDFVEGIASEPMMTSQAHSVCLLRVKDGTDVAQAKKDILANVNPNKWICVGVSKDNVRVESIGNLILLVMDNHAADELVANFLALAK